MTRHTAHTVVTSSHTLLKAAMDDLERATPNSRPGDKVSLMASDWQGNFIMTSRYGWLRVPE